MKRDVHMKFVNTNIAGLVVIETTVFHDDRGYFHVSYNTEAFQKNNINANFVQDNESQSKYGVIRGLHCQTGAYAQAKLVQVVAGNILDVAVDIRPNSPSFGQHFAIELSAENKKQLFIPRGFLHGFAVLSEQCIVKYKCDNTYNKASELTIKYNDPALAINWNIAQKDILISSKDDAGISFASYKEQLLNTTIS